MGRMRVLLELLSPLVSGGMGFLAGWFIWPLFDLPAMTGGLLGFCAATLLRFPLRPRRLKVPESWLAMIRQLLSYNLMRYVLMAGVCYALFFSTGWLQIVGGVLLTLLLLVKYTDVVLFSESERTISRWANGYFFSGSLTLAGGLSHEQPLLIGTGLLLHGLYWYACALGYSGSLAFYFDGANGESPTEPISP